MSLQFIIGIDPGASTGFAVWNIYGGQLDRVETLTPVAAFFEARRYAPEFTGIVFEDARLRTWFGNTSREVLQGAGSVKARCADWEEFCTLFQYRHYTLRPQDVRSINDAKEFSRVTKWTGRSSVHARDAAMMVFGLQAARFDLELKKRKK